MLLKSEKMELRGFTLNTSSKTGKTYKIANMETVSGGEAFSVYISDGSKFPALVSGKKGDVYYLTFKYNIKWNDLNLYSAEKVN